VLAAAFSFYLGIPGIFTALGVSSVLDASFYFFSRKKEGKIISDMNSLGRACSPIYELTIIMQLRAFEKLSVC
jgi:hypothetical protein